MSKGLSIYVRHHDHRNYEQVLRTISSEKIRAETQCEQRQQRMTLLCMTRKVKKISERTAQRRIFTHSEGVTEKRLTECAQHSDQGTVIN